MRHILYFVIVSVFWEKQFDVLLLTKRNETEISETEVKSVGKYQKRVKICLCIVEFCEVVNASFNRVISGFLIIKCL